MAAYPEDVPHYRGVERTDSRKRNSWGAIIAGAVVALSVQLLLVALGAAVGLSVVGASPESSTAKGVGIGAGVWWVIATLISLFCGGFVAARLSGMFRRSEGILHGAVTWGVFTLVGVLALGTLIGGAWNVLSTTATTAVSSGQVRDADATAAAERGEGAIRNAPEAAREAAGPTIGAAWAFFAMLLLGLAAAVAGGAAGIVAMQKEDRISGALGDKGDTRPGLAA